jgi:hypothetical protein
MSTKVCFKCGLPKDLETGFYRHPQMKDGHLNKCKVCATADVVRRSKEVPELLRDYERTRQQTTDRREKKKEYERVANEKDPTRARDYVRNCRARSPEKYKARTAVGNAVRDGRLVKQPCSDCGSTLRVQAHHEDYSKPLEVVWVCSDCHARTHGKVPTVDL